ncbi:MAG: tRNA lysidine(34) synthetase TilS [Acidobacteriota bacterium]|nr:tRNA lysidine(34) synthetase TilS [Acidobacteriota bacterium]
MGETLVERVEEIITRYNMIPPGARLGVAVSGGADSVVLLHILHRFAAQRQIEITVLHLNHQLRGTESDGDEEFVRVLADSLGLPCVTERTDLGAGNLEQVARDARREFFSRMQRELGLERVALGHTRSDQAETVLFRFLRGSGTAGLAGMRFVTAEGLIRPLLAESREEVRQWAITERIPWREDSSNENLKFARNRLRNEAIPSLAESFNPNLEGVLAGTADVAQAEEEYWDREISTVYGRISKRTQLGSFLQISDLHALHPAVLRRLIRRAIAEIRGDLRSIDLQHVDGIRAICASAHGHDRVIVPGVDALRSFGTLLLTIPGRLNSEKRQYRVNLELGTVHELPYRSGVICIDSVKSVAQFCANFKDERHFPLETAEIDGNALVGGELLRPLYVRNWEPGDDLQRPGHHGPQKLKSLFQEYKVLLWERRRWPVVVCGEEIVWVRRFGCAAKFQATADSPNRIQLRYREAVE